ncbi:periplasmic chaperone for outer membrane proteins SurA [Mariprofundus aestuarium]|uniref:Periplasmic chaperone for outer membrane proteins SurA n=1 Tax=Mariprofundus aestuarium TaxID=1921086 RepID=A0A2K8L0H3_MARES|nr:peptidylprolyl isomerase [Mariprofundus aestuarium]ATX80552.1 periplasmic chaperone for outer membrane proteins SurA [Mariprofundus aestuarium]
MRFTILLTAILMTVSAARAETFDSIAAVINHEAISCYDIQRETNDALKQLKASGAEQQASRAEIGRRILESKIVNTLQQQEAAKLELTVSHEEVEQAVQNTERQNNLMPGQLEQALAMQGMDFDEYKNKLRDQILVGKLINVAVRSKVNISEEALREYHRKHLANPKPRREVQLAQIFIPLSSEPSPAEVTLARNKAHDIHAQLSAGKAFRQLVALYSESPERQQDGIMGWFMEGGISQRFTPALELPIGAVTHPIRSPSGFHILKAVQERWKEPEATGESYDEVHARHILLQIPSFSDDKTRLKIRQRAERIAVAMNGASDEEFIARAKESSQGPSASQGGDLGWFRRGMMVPVFEESAFALNAGETSGVVESSFGLHIIRTVAKRHVDPNSLEAHRDNITQILTNVDMQERLPRWIEGLKSSANIEIRDCSSLDALPLPAEPKSPTQKSAQDAPGTTEK